MAYTFGAGEAKWVGREGLVPEYVAFDAANKEVGHARVAPVPGSDDAELAADMLKTTEPFRSNWEATESILKEHRNLNV